MSQENVQIAERATVAHNRRDLDALRSLNDADVESTGRLRREPRQAFYRGIDAVMRLHATYFDVFAEITIAGRDVPARP